MAKVLVENMWGVVEGLDYDDSRSLGERLNTEVEFQGTRLRFKPTRFALDLLVQELGKDSFHPGCRFAWAHFYKMKPKEHVDFEFVTEPYAHQREWWSTIKDLPYFALEWEMGLGKSKTILDVCHWLYSKGEIDGLLVVTEKDVHRKWVEKEVPDHLPKGMVDAAFWNAGRVEGGMRIGDPRKGINICDTDKFAVASLNLEIIHRKKGEAFARRFLKARKAVMVIDESHNIKTPSSEQTKACLRLGKLAKRRFILTGTMSAGQTLDAYSQYKFLSPHIVGGMSYGEFKSEFAVEEEVPGKTYEAWVTDRQTGKKRKEERPVKTVVGMRNEDKLRAMLDPYRSRLLKSDCIDLPEKIYRMRSFQLTDEANAAYQSMAREFVSHVGQHTVTATMAITKLIRLQQIACGFIVPDDVDPLEHPGTPLSKRNPRVDALMAELDQVQDKAVIWAYWRYSLREIAQALRTAYGDAAVVEYHGGVSDSDKTRARESFMKGDTAKFFVANPQSAGTGIDLYAAADAFYFNNSHNLILRLQSEDRIHRIGQTRACTYTDLEALGTIDRPQLRALKDKKDIAATISGDELRTWLTEAV